MTNEVGLNALGLLALLGGATFDSDPLAALGVGPDTPLRVRELVAKGLMYERQEEWRIRAQLAKRRRGRPTVKIDKDILRATFIIMWALDRVADDATDLAMIRKSVEFEVEMQALGRLKTKDRLFMGAESTLQKSVSRGSAKLEKSDYAQLSAAYQIIEPIISEVKEKTA